jgi:hypothetical protein
VVRVSRQREVTFDPEQVKSWEDTRANMNSPWSPNWTAPVVPAAAKWSSRPRSPNRHLRPARCGRRCALLGGDSVTVTVTR